MLRDICKQELVSRLLIKDGDYDEFHSLKQNHIKY